MFEQEDSMLAVASVSFSEGFSASFAHSWEIAVSYFLSTWSLLNWYQLRWVKISYHIL